MTFFTGAAKMLITLHVYMFNRDFKAYRLKNSYIYAMGTSKQASKLLNSLSHHFYYLHLPYIFLVVWKLLHFVLVPRILHTM